MSKPLRQRKFVIYQLFRTISVWTWTADVVLGKMEDTWFLLCQTWLRRLVDVDGLIPNLTGTTHSSGLATMSCRTMHSLGCHQTNMRSGIHIWLISSLSLIGFASSWGRSQGHHWQHPWTWHHDNVDHMGHHRTDSRRVKMDRPRLTRWYPEMLRALWLRWLVSFRPQEYVQAALLDTALCDWSRPCLCHSKTSFVHLKPVHNETCFLDHQHCRMIWSQHWVLRHCRWTHRQFSWCVCDLTS